MALTFYTNPMSRGRIVRWMLEEVGQPYDTVVMAFGPPMKTPDYLAINPMGKVPVLVHDHGVVTEAGAICTWLADTFPQAGLMPADRGALYRWMFFGAGPLKQAVTNGSKGWVPTAEERGRFGYGSMDSVMTTLIGHLGRNTYFCGDTFSAADVYVGSQIGWGLRFGTLHTDPMLQAYWDRIATRPALSRANALDDALMPPKS
ncbi:glutathione S-transferase family protein [Fuscibacter oryzae]|uniref:Glutathione S-transferase family protein n=1 Tax=Fuscibacter oryzae TaxID=2803939 RepID=A0A8J7MNI2_9RHOB|nr:glutathione S-transferase family protein [Fuscibacter oryzae]MBL4927056.1 glutathione S-transferase family protein [Fuscibacter oryzae]